MRTKPLMIAALAATTAFAGIAFAQQAAPNDAPATQVQQRPQAGDPERDDRGPPRFRDGDRFDRRPYGDRMGRFEDTMRERMARRCQDGGGRFGERMLERIERSTRPTEQQKPAFDALKAASAKAVEIMKAACPTEVSLTPPGRLADAEKRLTAMLEAVRLVRPAMETYYNSLTDEQKARLFMSRRAMMGPGMGPMMGPMGERHFGWRGEQRDNWRDRESFRERRFDRWRDHDDDGDQRGNRTRNEQDENRTEPL